MKKPQQTLFIVLALGLCGLCVYQWHAQTVQRQEIQQLEKSVYEKAAAIQGYTNSLANMDRQIAVMDARLTELKAEGRTNAELVTTRTRENFLLHNQIAGYTNVIEQYKAAVATLDTRLKEANEAIQKQNESVKDLVAQREELVRKFNESVKDRNDVVGKYNDLVSQVEKFQAAATNRPAAR